jgi:hypothetical protein
MAVVMTPHLTLFLSMERLPTPAQSPWGIWLRSRTSRDFVFPHHFISATDTNTVRVHSRAVQLIDVRTF